MFRFLTSRFLSTGIHPATRLFLWLLLLIAVQCLSGSLLAVAILVLPVFPWHVLRRGVKLVWRTRWLLLSLFVVFSWGVAGEPLWDGVAAPTYEGLVESTIHLARLILVLMLVAAFLEMTPFGDLLVATHTLFSPLRKVGFDPDRGVIRLMLVLRYAEDLPRARDWRSLLDAPLVDAPEWVEIDQRPFGLFDFALITLVIALAVVLMGYFYLR